jgi:hypothetical protein
VPHLAVVAFTVIAIVIVLIFVRFRFDKHFAKVVYLALERANCCVSICVNSYLFSLFGALKVLRFSISDDNE